MSEKENKRGRNWTLIVYPDSAPKNWRDILDDEHITWVESPLHDKDVNPDGEVKKAHWHVLLQFEGKKSFRQVAEIADDLNSPIPKYVQSAKGLVRYMIHMDNPEKFQYKKSDIIGHGGADISSFFELSATNRLDILKDIVNFIRDNNVTEFADLTFYAIEHDSDWFDVIANHNSIFLRNLLASMRNQQILSTESEKSVNQVDKKQKAREMRAQGVKVTQIAETLGVNRSMVYKYLTNE